MFRKISIFVLSVSILAFLNACAKESPKVESAQATAENVTNPNNMPSFFKTDIPESSATASPNTSAALTNIDEKSLLAGTWRFSWGANNPNCGSEMILFDNGNYSGMGGCAGWVPTRTVGKWELVAAGTVRVTYSDYEPKQDQAGNPIRIPRWETWKFRFIDRNRMALGDGAVIAYRVN